MNQYEMLLENKTFTWFRRAQFALALLIYTSLLLLPSSQVSQHAISDFVLHAIGNIALVLSTWLASAGRFKGIGPLLFVIPFSVFTELAQGLTDNRTPQLIDIGANFLGAFIGFGLCFICDFVVEQLRSKPAKAA
jgi:VanZ family protein